MATLAALRRVDAVQPNAGAVDLDRIAVDDGGYAAQIGVDRFAGTGRQSTGEDKGQGGKGGIHQAISQGPSLPSHWAEWRKAHCGNCLLRILADDGRAASSRLCRTCARGPNHVHMKTITK